VVRVAAFVALVASALIALLSCSSGPPSLTSATSAATSGLPATSAQSSSPAVNASSSAVAASATASSVRIRLLTEVFATALPTDPAKAKVIQEFRESQILWDQSSEELRIVAPATEYITGAALGYLRAAVTSGAKDDVALGGTDRLYDTSVTSLKGNNATVVSCDDGSRTNMVDLATGQKIPNDPTGSLIVYVSWQMAQVSGHWAITSLDVIYPPDPRASACLTG
jgi:hypothetical protein